MRFNTHPHLYPELLELLNKIPDITKLTVTEDYFYKILAQYIHINRFGNTNIVLHNPELINQFVIHFSNRTVIVTKKKERKKKETV